MGQHWFKSITVEDGIIKFTIKDGPYADKGLTVDYELHIDGDGNPTIKEIGVRK